jgi:hypothetical protein
VRIELNGNEVRGIELNSNEVRGIELNGGVPTAARPW